MIKTLVLLALFGPSIAWADGTTFTDNCSSVDWTAVTTNEDGTALTDLAGYSLYDRPTLSSLYGNPIATVGATTTSIPCPSLNPSFGQHYYSVTAFDTSGNISTHSTDAAFVIAQTVVTNPNPVSDLTITATSPTSLTVQWTEINDGTGNPAKYAVRYAFAPSLSQNFGWGSATDVASGTCTTPVTGTTIGATKTCTITGLLDATVYDVQLVPFRGTLNVNAVFGPLSNVATATTNSYGSIFLEAISQSAITTTNSVSWSHTIGQTDGFPNIGTILLVTPKIRHSASCTVSSITANGQAMTFIRRDDRNSGTDHYITELWYLTTPGAGANTIVTTWGCTPSEWASAWAVSLAQVDTTSPIDAQSGATGNGTAIATTITTVAANAWIVDSVIGQANSGLTVGSGQTARENRIVGPNVDGAGTSTVNGKSTPGAEVMDWTQSTAENWAISAVSLVPLPAPGSMDTTPPPQVTGVTATVLGSTSVRLDHAAVVDNSGGTITYFYEQSSNSGASWTVLTSNTLLTYTVTGLAPSTTYHFRVRAQDPSLNFGAYSQSSAATTFSAPDTTAPSQVVNLVCTATSQTTVTCSWTAATDNVGVTTYDVQRSPSGCASFATIASPVSTVLSYGDTGLSSGTGYCYKVRANDAAANHGSYSGNATVTTLASPPADTTAPSTIQQLSGTVDSETTISYVWSAATDANGIHHYNLYSCTTSACSTKTLIQQQIPPSSTLSLQRTGLTASTAYIVCVTAVDPSGNEGTCSASLTLTTLAAPDITPPAQLTNLMLLSSTFSSVVLSFDIPDEVVLHATIRRCIGSTCTPTVIAGTTTSNVFVDTQVLPGQAYRYDAFFTDLANNVGLPSSQIMVTVPTVPIGTTLGICPCKRRN